MSLKVTYKDRNTDYVKVIETDHVTFDTYEEDYTHVKKVVATFNEGMYSNTVVPVENLLSIID